MNAAGEQKHDQRGCRRPARLAAEGGEGLQSEAGQQHAEADGQRERHVVE